jgi:PAS domain S-box-containing protein
MSAMRGAEAAIALGDGHVDCLSIESGGAACLLSVDGRIVEASGRLCAVLGFEVDELVGTSPPFPFCDAHAGSSFDRALLLARSGRRIQLEIALQRSGGERFAALVDVARFDGGGDPYDAAILCLVRDVSSRAEESNRIELRGWDPIGDRARTARVEGEARVRVAEGNLQTVTGSMGEGVFTLDPGGRVIYLNAAAERMLGWASSEFVGELASVVLEVEGDTPFAMAAPSAGVRCDHTLRPTDDSVFVRRNGTKLPVAYTTSPFATSDGGQSSVVIFSDITPRKAEEERTRLALKSFKSVEQIRQALDHKSFWLAAQPIVEVASRRVVQHELLLRMRDGRGRTIGPGQFLPAAEASGLIRDIDRWVARRGISLVGLGHAIAINISASSLGDPDLFQVIDTILAETGADPSLVTFELTETAVLANERMAQTFIKLVSGLGCRIAFDDFGTGYGGFTYLKRLPVNYLKIDREFVRDLNKSAASRHVIEAIVSLARGFGQETIAEGVEHSATLTLLADMGVDYAQGYAVGRPTPADKVFGLL